MYYYYFYFLSVKVSGRRNCFRALDGHRGQCAVGLDTLCSVWLLLRLPGRVDPHCRAVSDWIFFSSRFFNSGCTPLPPFNIPAPWPTRCSSGCGCVCQCVVFVVWCEPPPFLKLLGLKWALQPIHNRERCCSFFFFMYMRAEAFVFNSCIGDCCSNGLHELGL